MPELSVSSTLCRWVPRPVAVDFGGRGWLVRYARALHVWHQTIRHERVGVGLSSVKALGDAYVMGNIPRTAPKPGERTAVKGWTPAAASRNRNALAAIDFEAMLKGRIDQVAFSLTLTVGDIPTAADWILYRQQFIQYLRNHLEKGFAYHWVVEWQERGAPHLHLMIFTTKQRFKTLDCVGAWLRISASCRPLSIGQRLVKLYNNKGWTRYLASHGGRSVRHYQRRAGFLPPGWDKSGRLWGKGGRWVKFPEVKFVTFSSYQRIIKKNLGFKNLAPLDEPEHGFFQWGQFGKEWEGLPLWRISVDGVFSPKFYRVSASPGGSDSYHLQPVGDPLLTYADLVRSLRDCYSECKSDILALLASLHGVNK